MKSKKKTYRRDLPEESELNYVHSDEHRIFPVCLDAHPHISAIISGRFSLSICLSLSLYVFDLSCWCISVQNDWNWFYVPDTPSIHICSNSHNIIIKIYVYIQYKIIIMLDRNDTYIYNIVLMWTYIVIISYIVLCRDKHYSEQWWCRWVVVARLSILYRTMMCTPHNSHPLLLVHIDLTSYQILSNPHH